MTDDETCEVIYRDEHLVAVNKPSGLLVHRSLIDRHETRFALQLVRDQLGQHVYPVHRLDKPTSGVLLFGLSSDSARRLSAQFAAGAMRPLVGAAIAATVALIAIVALQNTGLDESPEVPPVPFANESVPQLDAQQERQRQYFLNHVETSSEHGANGLSSQVVTLRFSEDLVELPDPDLALEPVDPDVAVESNDTTTPRP